MIYTDCASSFTGAVFDPGASHQTSCTPSVTIIAPANNSNLNTSSVTFNASTDQQASWCGISISGNANQTMSLSATRANYTNSSIADGTYSFIVSCNNSANNYGQSAAYNFLVDTIYPNISFITPPTPADSSSQSSTSIFVNVSASDANNLSTFIDFDNSLVGWWRMDDTNQSVGTLGAKVYDISGHCYDNETEILTEEGWMLFKDLKDQKVMTLNQETGRAKYQKPTEKQVFDYNKEMYNIELEDGSNLKVSEKHRVYSSLNNLSSMFVVNISTFDCLLNASSSDQIGALTTSARAKYAASSLCGEISSASCTNPQYLPASNVSILLSSSESKKEKARPSIFAYLLMRSCLLDNSSNKYDGTNNRQPLRDRDSKILLLSESFLKNENNIDASTKRRIH